MDFEKMKKTSKNYGFTMHYWNNSNNDIAEDYVQKCCNEYIIHMETYLLLSIGNSATLNKLARACADLNGYECGKVIAVEEVQ